MDVQDPTRTPDAEQGDTRFLRERAAGLAVRVCREVTSNQGASGAELEEVNLLLRAALQETGLNTYQASQAIDVAGPPAVAGDAVAYANQVAGAMARLARLMD